MATKVDKTGKVIADKPTRSGYVPGSLYKKMESKKVKFKETDNTKEEINPIAFIEKNEWKNGWKNGSGEDWRNY